MSKALKTSVVLMLTPCVCLVLVWAVLAVGESLTVAVTAAVTLLCAVWWVMEPIPIPITSLIPIAVFPLFSVLTPNQVAEAYGNPMILLFLGGFMLSTAMEGSGAHRRLALTMVNGFGGNSHRRVVLGFMSAAAVLSMWVSNTATALMLLPVALAILQENTDRRFAIALLLGTCYACSLGGIGTPIGTPPNLIFMRVYTETTGTEIGFVQWMLWAMPVVIVFFPLMALWLTRHLKSGQIVNLPDAGEWTREQKRVLFIFGLTAVFWMTRKEPFGGWSELLHVPQANDAVVALLAVVTMFLVPNTRGGRLLDWDTARKIPWDVLLLFAGGITIAKAFTVSGLAEDMASSLSVLTGLHVWLVIGCVCLTVTFLTEVTSNTAITSLLMPIMAIAAAAMKVDPALLMVPAAISASCAFMLPVATPPNAIIFSSGRVTVQQMVRYGFVLNLIGVLVVSTVAYWLRFKVS